MLLQNLRYAFRVLHKSPGFTAVAVLVLCLGIGTSTAVFSVVNALLIQPLPYKDPSSLVVIWQTWAQKGLDRIPVLIPDFIYWKDNNQSFESVAAFQNMDFNLTGQNEPELIYGARVSASFFPTLGVNSSLGRVFLPEEDHSGSPVVVLSHGLWQRRFGSDPDLIGKGLTLNDQSYTVIGIMPTDFRFSLEWNMAGLKFPNVELWVPLALSSQEMASRSGHDLTVIAKLKPGAKLEQAQSEMNIIASSLQQQQPDVNAGIGANVVSLHTQLVGDTKSSLLILSGAVAFVLLIACANVANLMLVRASARQKEIAIRIALGATRVKLIGQLLTESILLWFVGGGLGLLFALWATKFLISFSSTELNRASKIAIDFWALSFTILISILTAVLFGLVPALQASNPDLNKSLKEGSGRSTADSSRQRVRSLLVISEVALALMLLIGAGLLIRSFLQLQKVSLGFKTDNLLTMKISLPDSRYPKAYQQAASFQQAIKQVESLPGVEGVAVASHLPFEESWEILFTNEGQPSVPVRETPIASGHAVSPDYFRLMSIPLVSGRYFTDQDVEDSTRVVIIDEALGLRYWPNENPLGKHIKRGPSQSKAPWLTIVGVVKSVRQYGLDSEVKPEVYLPYLQSPRAAMSMVLRSKIPPKNLAEAVRREIQKIDNDQPVYDVRTMDEILYLWLSPRRFNLLVLGVFAAVSLILTAVGLYGLVAYYVAQRINEIGIRMALGAQPRDIFKLVMGHGMLLALSGVAIGLAGAFTITRILSSLVYDVSTTDPATFTAISLLLVVVTMLACYIPAYRASKVDPVLAIRQE